MATSPNHTTLIATCRFFTKDDSFDPRDPKNKEIVGLVQGFMEAAAETKARQAHAAEMQAGLTALQERIAEYREARGEKDQKEAARTYTEMAQDAEEEKAEELQKATEEFEKLRLEWKAYNKELLEATQQLTGAQQDLAMHLNASKKLHEKQYEERCNALDTCLDNMVKKLAEMLDISLDDAPDWLKDIQKTNARALEAEMENHPEFTFRMPPISPTPTAPTPKPEMKPELTEDEQKELDRKFEKEHADKLNKRMEHLKAHVLGRVLGRVPQEQLDRLVATHDKAFQGAFNFYFSASKQHAATELGLNKICRNSMAETLRLQQRCEIIYGKGSEVEERLKPQITKSPAPMPKPTLKNGLDEQLKLLAQLKIEPQIRPDTAPKPTPPGSG